MAYIKLSDAVELLKMSGEILLAEEVEVVADKVARATLVDE
jgi:hypothetical protein